MSIEWEVLEPPTYIAEKEMSEAQRACARAIHVIETGLQASGVGAGSYRIGKWDGQQLLYYLRKAIAEEKP